MANAEQQKKRAKSNGKPERVCTQFRFLNDEHYRLVNRAATVSGLSMNSWLVQATLRQARTELTTK